MRSYEELRLEAGRLATELMALIERGEADDGGGNRQGSAHRKLPVEIQRRLIDWRSELLEIGVFDPVLIRFDTATAPQAGTRRIAEQLAAIAGTSPEA
jgi:hypothetical protein